jgi:predicted dithiol-disulfide oxidoreductase (DUF899 family)
MEAPKKRKRGANFSPFEKSTLLNLVHKYKNIVSNNKTDAVAVEEKEKCWKRITEEFNFESPNGKIPFIVDKLDLRNLLYCHIRQLIF